MADTLCGTCTRGADECGFMADMLPVPGWEAEKVVYKHQQGKKSYTYAVKECPLFVKKNSTPKRKRKIKSENADHIFQKKKRKVMTACLYGVKHFCDGKPNVSYGVKDTKPPCQFYKGGKCTKADMRD